MNKNARWQEELLRVGRLKDKLGMPVDAGIAETVAILRLMGIHTIMSCEGHLERFTGGPYIMFESPEADEYRKQAATLNNPTGGGWKKLYKKAIKLSLLEQQKLYPLLEKFYTTREVTFGQMLTLRSVGYSVARLYCQSAELAHINNKETQEKILMHNRAEMRAFTDYLKNLYFTSEENEVLFVSHIVQNKEYFP